MDGTIHVAQVEPVLTGIIVGFYDTRCDLLAGKQGQRGGVILCQGGERHFVGLVTQHDVGPGIFGYYLFRLDHQTSNAHLYVAFAIHTHRQLALS